MNSSRVTGTHWKMFPPAAKIVEKGFSGRVQHFLDGDGQALLEAINIKRNKSPHQQISKPPFISIFIPGSFQVDSPPLPAWSDTDSSAAIECDARGREFTLAITWSRCFIHGGLREISNLFCGTQSANPNISSVLIRKIKLKQKPTIIKKK